MSRVTVDRATGTLRVAGAKTFPLGLSNPPPLGSKAPNGVDGLEEVADAGVTFIRTGRGDWGPVRLEGQIAAERAVLDAAALHGLHCWLYLGELPDLPPRAAGTQASTREQMLTRLTSALREHPALAPTRESTSPAIPSAAPTGSGPPGSRAPTAAEGARPTAPARDHPGSAQHGRPARAVPACIRHHRRRHLPIAYPPGEHSDLPNKDISVVGDMTRKMVRAAGGKPVWMTLQIAWNGTVNSARKPNVVPRFPTRHELRFMAYQAIVAGARELMFFGGHLTQASRPADAESGWNWTFWEQALRPLLEELSSTAVAPALVGANAKPQVKTTAKDVEVLTRREGRFLYAIGVRRGGGTSRVAFTGLPKKLNGTPLTGGQVLFEYLQEPPPPPIGAGRQKFRSTAASGGGFRDWLGRHEARVYRFAL